MSQFINTQHKVMIDSLVEGLKEKLKNPYYFFTDKKASIVDYYNTNLEKTTLDEASRLSYSPLGKDSPKKYNLIKDAFLFGIERIIVSLDNGEYGLEAETIEGDALVLPNTFIPCQEDYFSITYLTHKLLFKVLSVTPDTLDTGANFYKITYKLDQTDENVIKDQVVNEYSMLVNNVGTKYNTVIRSNDYNLIQNLENILLTLKKYYKTLFFSKKIQTFVVKLDNDLFYDPFLIEFLLRNKILEGDDEYTYVAHATFLPNTFTIDYNKTFFRAIELKDRDDITSYQCQSIGEYIKDPNSLMSTRIEKYFKIKYIDELADLFKPQINNFDHEIIDMIKNNTYYDDGDHNRMRNIVIGYFNNNTFKTSLIDILEKIDYQSNMELFYMIPLIIYIVEYDIKTLLK